MKYYEFSTCSDKVSVNYSLSLGLLNTEHKPSVKKKSIGPANRRRFRILPVGLGRENPDRFQLWLSGILPQWFCGYVRTVEYIQVLLRYLASVTEQRHSRIQYNSDGKPGQFMFETKKKFTGQTVHFTACFNCGTTNRQKFEGVGGMGIPSKKTSQRICTNWKNSPKRKWGATCPPGGATGKEAHPGRAVAASPPNSPIGRG